MKKYAGAAILFCVLVLLIMGGAASAQEEPPPLPPVSGEQPETPAINVYFYINGELAPVGREVPGGGQMAEFTVIELLKGPSEEEAAEGYITFIPEGVKLQYSTVKNDRTEYTVCLSRELLALKGDPEGAAKALAQIEKTAMEASGAGKIGITIAAEASGDQPEDAYTALGVPREEDQESEDTGINVGLLILVIVLGVALGVSLLLVSFYFSRKRQEARKPAKSSKGKKKAGKSGTSKKTKMSGMHEKSKKRPKE